jgi:glycosyltransferase involved in cell wall biosynthesis
MKKTVPVSIIAANYNNGKYLTEFIDSIVNSTVLPFELIILNDGCTDNSLEILEKYKGLDFLRVITFEKNQGNPACVNTGLEIATGKYIMRADPDDCLLPERLRVQSEFLDAHPEIDVLGSNVRYFHGDNKTIINESNVPIFHEQIADTFRAGEHGLLQPSVMVRGEVFRRYRYRNTFPAEDYELFSRMVRDGYRFSNIDTPLYLQRIHPGSSTSNLKISGIKQTFKFRDEIFGTKTSKVWVWIYFHFIRNYRAYQMSENAFSKYYHLFLSGMLYPAKVVRRLRGYGKS